jgi:hypothetical protein
MRIEWNHVTWYSKLGAVIFFLAILPVITFFIGSEYQKTVQILSASQTSQNTEGDTYKTNNESGINGTVIQNGSPYIDGLRISEMENGKVIETAPNQEGKFLLLLPPGTYTIEKTSIPGLSLSAPINVVSGKILRLDLTIK